MNDPWFAQETGRWFAFLSMLSLVAVLSDYAEQGRYRIAVMRVWAATIAFGGLIVVVAAVGFFAGQPWYVVKTLGLSGLLVAGMFAATLHTVRRAYDRAEVRRTIAADL